LVLLSTGAGGRRGVRFLVIIVVVDKCETEHLGDRGGMEGG
jgi:hypothetical protein